MSLNEAWMKKVIFEKFQKQVMENEVIKNKFASAVQAVTYQRPSIYVDASDNYILSLQVMSIL